MSGLHLGRSEMKEAVSKEAHHDHDRYLKMRDVSLIGVIANVLLCALKITMGWIAQSQSLIADGVHSLADAMTDVAVIVTARFSNAAADASHPYGHARIETAATAGLGVVLMVTGLGIVLDAVGRLMDPGALFQPTALALGAALASILVNEVLFQYTRRVGRRIRSALLIANAWHHRTDALSSVVVFIGVGGVLLGWESLDAIAAIGVALMIIHVGWGQLRAAFVELVDSGLSPERIEEIRNKIESINGVSHPHRLRTRRMGEHVLVDVHVEVPPRVSVSEGHQLAESVQALLKQELDDVSDVTVHIDPEHQSRVWLDLPLRSKVEADLKSQWTAWLGESALTDLSQLDLHYLNGAIEVEVVWKLPAPSLDEMSGTALSDLVQKIQTPAQSLDYIERISVRFELT